MDNTGRGGRQWNHGPYAAAIGFIEGAGGGGRTHGEQGGRFARSGETKNTESTPTHEPNSTTKINVPASQPASQPASRARRALRPAGTFFAACTASLRRERAKEALTLNVLLTRFLSTSPASCLNLSSTWGFQAQRLAGGPSAYMHD